MKDLNNKKVMIDPFWVSGFVDGGGCFCVSFNLRDRMCLGVEVKPSFSISQSGDKAGMNFNCLQQLMSFFGCGAIRFSKKDNTWKYECRDLAHIRSNIIPHFVKFPLRTKKQKDFELFVSVVNMLSSKQHLNEDGLRHIIEISYQINFGKRKLSKEVLLSKIISKKHNFFVSKIN